MGLQNPPSFLPAHKLMASGIVVMMFPFWEPYLVWADATDLVQAWGMDREMAKAQRESTIGAEGTTSWVPWENRAQTASQNPQQPRIKEDKSNVNQKIY